jgi:hypothetical protein
MSRPCDVVVSAQASLRERKPAFGSVMAASVFSRSRVERARRSSRVHHQQVAGAKRGDGLAQLGAVGLGSARHFPEHFPGAGSAERGYLCCDALAPVETLA